MTGSQVNDDEQTRTNINAFNGIRTHGVQAIKTYASHRAATGTGEKILFQCHFVSHEYHFKSPEIKPQSSL
jgi:hypothetical protein